MLMVYILGTLYVLSVIIPYFLFKDEEIIDIRKKQSLKKSRRDRLQKSLDGIINDRIKYSKQVKLETFIRQSGLNLSIGEFYSFSIILALLFSISAHIILNNIGITILFLLLGFVFLKEFLKILKTRRMKKINDSIPLFFELFIEKYKTSENFKEAFINASFNLKTEKTLYKELKVSSSQLKSGFDVEQVLIKLAERTNNRYLKLLSFSYFKIDNFAKKDDRVTALTEIYKQAKEDRTRKINQKKRINAPQKEAMIMWFAVIGVVIYQSLLNTNYIPFMTSTFVGKIGTLFIVFVLVSTFWFINSKLNAPIE